MGMMPAPYDCTWGDLGILIEKDQGAFVYKEESKPLATSFATPITITDWSRGVGVARGLGIPETLGALHRSGGEAPFAGVDGSYGPLMPGPEILGQAISAGKRCRALAMYGDLLYIALDNLIYTSANHLGTDAVLFYTAAGNITSLAAAQLQNSVSLLYIAQEGGPYLTYDGTSVQQDAPTAIRNGNPQAIFRTTNGTDYLDFTGVLTDNNTATGMDVNSFGTTAGNTWFVVGFWQPFTAINVVIGQDNGTSRTIVLEAWDGSAWQPIAGVTDGTSDSGRTFFQTGKITFPRPSAWEKTVLNESSSERQTYFVRVSFSGTVDSSTSATGISVDYREEVNAFGKAGVDVLWAVYQNNRVMYTKTGGRKPTWVKSSQDADSNGAFVGMAAVQNVLYVKRTTDLFAPDQSGRLVSYADDEFLQPAEPDDGVMLSWDQKLFFSHRQRLYAWSPVSGLDSIGPERYITSDTEAVQSTMICGAPDRSHCLYLASYDATSQRGFLWRYGAFRQFVDPDSGTLQWGRSNVLSMISDLGDVKVTRMSVEFSGDQPYLLLATDDGTIYRATCPRGVSPLDANSGYRWTQIPSFGDLPTQDGDNPASKVVLTGLSMSTRNTNATCTVSVYAKAHTSSVWNLVAVVNAPSLQRRTFEQAIAGAGVDVRLVLRASSATNPPLVDTLVLNAMQDAQLEQRTITLSARVDEQMQDNDGFAIPWDPDGYKAQMDRIAGRSEPQAFVTPFGETVFVKTASVGQVIASAVEKRQLSRVIPLVLSVAS